MSTAPKPPPSPARLLRSINSLCELLALDASPWCKPRGFFRTHRARDLGADAIAGDKVA